MGTCLRAVQAIWMHPTTCHRSFEQMGCVMFAQLRQHLEHSHVSMEEFTPEPLRYSILGGVGYSGVGTSQSNQQQQERR